MLNTLQGPTDRLRVVDLALVLDDGAVQLLLLRPQLQLQLPVLLLLATQLCVVAAATAHAPQLLPVHDLRQLVDGLPGADRGGFKWLKLTNVYDGLYCGGDFILEH